MQRSARTTGGLVEAVGGRASALVVVFLMAVPQPVVLPAGVASGPVGEGAARPRPGSRMNACTTPVPN
jgi:hypothetical protein